MCGVQRDRAARFIRVSRHRRLPSRWTISNWYRCAFAVAYGYTSRAPTKQRTAAERNHEKGKRFGDRSECSLPDPVLDLMNTTRNVISLARATSIPSPPFPWFPSFSLPRPLYTLPLSPLSLRHVVLFRVPFRKVIQKKNPLALRGISSRKYICTGLSFFVVLFRSFHLPFLLTR